MSYWLYKMIHPFTLWLILAIWAYLSKTKYSKYLRLLTIVLFLLFTNPYLINTLITHHESRYPAQPQMDSTRAYHILVLGAGKNDDERLWAHQRLSGQALTRLVAGVHWAHRLPHAILIGSGPKGKYGKISQAQHMVETAKLLGIHKERLYMQEEVVNTRTEAEAYVAAFGTETPLILCTSALHMPRAVKWFEHYGVQEVIPAPASYQAPKGRITWKDFVPSLGSFGKWQGYGKEVVGERFIRGKVYEGLLGERFMKV